MAKLGPCPCKDKKKQIECDPLDHKRKGGGCASLDRHANSPECMRVAPGKGHNHQEKHSPSCTPLLTIQALEHTIFMQ
eukprot:scaffold120521_cov13-Tisochrysis_lutea.AAC.1